MRRLWLLPIEPFEERYTAQWFDWFGRELRQRFDVHVVVGGRLDAGIVEGQFLDVYDTHFWKATQLAEMVKLARNQQLTSDDVVLILDAWNPAVTALSYIRDAGQRPFKIVGLMHAGTWDPWDFLTQRGLDRWAADVEEGWLAALDKVCVATDFHRDLLVAARGADRGKVAVTGFPLYARDWQQHAVPWDARRRLVVFPHRIAPEKDPQAWHGLVAAYRERYPLDEAEFVMTKEACRTKLDYYQLLGQARVAVSTARQETWGIAMLEAVSLGCWPVVPERLSYVDTMPREARYTELSQALTMIRAGLDRSAPAPWDGSRWESAISQIAQVCEDV